MGSDGDGPSSSAQTRARARLRRTAFFVVLLAAVAVFAYLRAQSPQEQHVRIVLGAGAADVMALRLAYVDPQGAVAREAQFTYEPGRAPRVVAHEPALRNGDYRLDIEIDTRDGRRTIQRQVTLGGGSTQIDVSSKLAPSPSSREP